MRSEVLKSSGEYSPIVQTSSAAVMKIIKENNDVLEAMCT